jgi:hypothetical protein
MAAPHSATADGLFNHVRLRGCPAVHQRDVELLPGSGGLPACTAATILAMKSPNSSGWPSKCQVNALSGNWTTGSGTWSGRPQSIPLMNDGEALSAFRQRGALLCLAERPWLQRQHSRPRQQYGSFGGSFFSLIIFYPPELTFLQMMTRKGLRNLLARKSYKSEWAGVILLRLLSPPLLSRLFVAE